jgi:hypothetical protein
MPGRLEDSKDVDASIEAPKNLLADEPGHLTVVEAEADQLRSLKTPDWRSAHAIAPDGSGSM